MTLEQLMNELSDLAKSNPEMLTEQVSIMEPDYENGYSVKKLDIAFISNETGGVFSHEELTEEFEEDERKEYVKSVIIKG
jgi:hypothetical protein